MSRRFPVDFPIDELTPEQRRVNSEILKSYPNARVEGRCRGPFAVWLRIPEMADRANHFANVIWIDGKLDRRLFELAVIVVARHYSAAFEWFAHSKRGLEVGLSPEVVEAIRTRQVPRFDRPDEKLVYEVVTELNEIKKLSQPTYDRALAALGLDNLIELVTTVGWYILDALIINAFDLPAPSFSLRLASGEQPLPIMRLDPAP